MGWSGNCAPDEACTRCRALSGLIFVASTSRHHPGSGEEETNMPIYDAIRRAPVSDDAVAQANSEAGFLQEMWSGAAAGMALYNLLLASGNFLWSYRR